jgi:hypothetical protein
VNQTFLQLFAAYTFPDARLDHGADRDDYDWEGEVWTVPVALGVSKVLTVGAPPVSLALQGRYWVEGRRSGASGRW